MYPNKKKRCYKPNYNHKKDYCNNYNSSKNKQKNNDNKCINNRDNECNGYNCEDNRNPDYADIETIYNKSYGERIPYWGPVVNPRRAWIGYGLGRDISIQITAGYEIGNWVALIPDFTLINLFAPVPAPFPGIDANLNEENERRRNSQNIPTSVQLSKY